LNILIRQKYNKSLFLLPFYFASLLGLSACDNQDNLIENQKTASITTEVKTPIAGKTQTNGEMPTNDKIIIENKSYLFDISDHSMEEFQALLTRAEEVSQAQSPDFENLEIVMVIHGPDIEWFTQENYEYNRQLIDLAARLDAHDIIDMKVCEKTMSDRGVEREDLPAFIESVPYVPVEIENRLRDGYINL
jgi:uncharacterized protein